VVPLDGGTAEVGWLEDHGWLQGFRHCVDRFAIRTGDRREIPIPAGAPLVAQLPLWSTRARIGERGPVLCAGDRIRVTGFVTTNGEGPFRSSSCPIPGARGLIVYKKEGEAPSLNRELVLLLWRPSLFYVCAIALAALPGLATYLALTSPLRP